MKKKYLMMPCLLLAICYLTGCSRPVPEPEEPTPPAEEIIKEAMEEEEKNPVPEGMAASPLTGLWIPEEMAAVRPVAMQINNSREAFPQSGLAQADLIYETLAEGSITRLMAVFHHYDATKIGPIRSARHYYLDMAANHDALYMHYGGSPQAYAYIRQVQAPALDGLPKPDGVLSWRDPERRAIPRMLEHSVYTSKALIDEAWEKAGYRREIREDFTSGLVFKQEGSAPWGQRADYVMVPFSSSYTSTFVYDPVARDYVKYQTGELHMDELTAEPLRFTNLIIQRTEVFVIPGDDAGRREVKIIGKGTGHYISHGRAVAIQWSKASYGDPTHYFETKTGRPVMMNPGKTYIAIAPERMNVTLVKPAE